MSESHICKPKERLICADCYNSLVEETCEQEAEITQLREQVRDRNEMIEKIERENDHLRAKCLAASAAAGSERIKCNKLQATIEHVRAIVFKTYSALPGITIGEIRKALSESEES